MTSVNKHLCVLMRIGHNFHCTSMAAETTDVFCPTETGTVRFTFDGDTFKCKSQVINVAGMTAGDKEKVIEYNNELFYCLYDDVIRENLVHDSNIQCVKLYTKDTKLTSIRAYNSISTELLWCHEQFMEFLKDIDGKSQHEITSTVLYGMKQCINRIKYIDVSISNDLVYNVSIGSETDKYIACDAGVFSLPDDIYAVNMVTWAFLPPMASSGVSSDAPSLQFMQKLFVDLVITWFKHYKFITRLTDMEYRYYVSNPSSKTCMEDLVETLSYYFCMMSGYSQSYTSDMTDKMRSYLKGGLDPSEISLYKTYQVHGFYRIPEFLSSAYSNIDTNRQLWGATKTCPKADVKIFIRDPSCKDKLFKPMGEMIDEYETRQRWLSECDTKLYLSREERLKQYDWLVDSTHEMEMVSRQFKRALCL